MMKDLAIMENKTLKDKIKKMEKIISLGHKGLYVEKQRKTIAFAMRPDLDIIESYIFKGVRKCIAAGWFDDSCSAAVSELRRHYEDTYSVNWDKADDKRRPREGEGIIGSLRAG